MVRKFFRKLRDLFVYGSTIVTFVLASTYFVLSVYFDLMTRWGRPLFTLITVAFLSALILYLYLMMEVRLKLRSVELMRELENMDMSVFFDNDPETFHAMGEEWNKDA